jgi:very-short-patch-repair endonuclease
MGILESKVMVSVGNNRDSYYESKGYEIPKYKDKHGRSKVPKHTKIEIDVNDLPENSTIKVHKICDYCLKTSEKPQSYQSLISCRKKNGKDCCKKCKYIKREELHDFSKSSVENSLAVNFPEIATQWHKKNNKSPLEVFSKSDQDFWWLDENCNHEWIATVKNRTLNGSGCPYCTNKKVNDENCLDNTDSIVLREWDYQKNDELNLTPKEVTVGSRKSVFWRCVNCRHSWKATIKARMKEDGTNCPRCNSSKGEKAIMSFLDNMSIFYMQQVRLKDCKNMRSLIFDFIVHHNGEIVFIEYDGKQHFEPVNFGKLTDEEVLRDFQNIQERDRIKDNYCFENKVELIRIPYWDFNNIEMILTNKFFK